MFSLLALKKPMLKFFNKFLKGDDEKEKYSLPWKKNSIANIIRHQFP
jgi:hypothetical protein